MNSREAEAVTARVYGETFARYNREEFLEFLRPIEVRLAANGIALDVFAGKRCLDAGCGGGRATVLMARAGASEVVAYDLARQNADTTARNARLFDLSQVQTRCGSLLDIPFPDESFDVVWCNGVLHHTAQPDAALREVARVLKTGGWMWLYLYGAGGIYWYMVDFFRAWLKEIGPARTMAILQLADAPTGRIAEFLDDWFVPYLKRYTHADVARRLEELGFGEPRRLEGGMPYDTSVRRANPDERVWLGEGDLRYWAQKTGAPASGPAHPLPDVGGRGSAFEDAEPVRPFGHEFYELACAAKAVDARHPGLGPVARVLAAARVQARLRDTFARPEPFDPEAFRRFIGGQVALLNGLPPAA